MHDTWSTLATALESGDPDRVNDAIDDINDMGLAEQVELFDACFDEVTDMYAAAADGYVRQSLVRVADELTPGIPTVVALESEDRLQGVDETTIQEHTDALCGFLLEALTDEDGRVRQSARRGLKDVCRTYDALDDEETIEALIVELEEMASAASGKQEQHLREAKADVRATRQSGIARLVEGFHEEFRDSLRRDE